MGGAVDPWDPPARRVGAARTRAAPAAADRPYGASASTEMNLLSMESFGVAPAAAAAAACSPARWQRSRALFPRSLHTQLAAVGVAPAAAARSPPPPLQQRDSASPPRCASSTLQPGARGSSAAGSGNASGSGSGSGCDSAADDDGRPRLWPPPHARSGAEGGSSAPSSCRRARRLRRAAWATRRCSCSARARSASGRPSARRRSRPRRRAAPPGPPAPLDSRHGPDERVARPRTAATPAWRSPTRRARPAPPACAESMRVARLPGTAPALPRMTLRLFALRFMHIYTCDQLNPSRIS